MTEPTPPPGVDVSKPNVARMYDYYLGGTLNYPIDRAAADRIIELEPLAKATAWANRGFLQRAASWIAGQGVDQFIDLGAGLPTMNNTHDVVHKVNPKARVVCVDADPEVCAHANQLIANVDYVYYVSGDLRRMEELLTHPVVTKHIDFDRPVGLVVAGLMYFVADPYEPMRTLIERVGEGSYLALSHLTAEHRDPDYVAEGVKVYQNATEQLFPRSRADIERLFEGLEFVPPYKGASPGLSYIGMWGAEDPTQADDETSRWMYAGVAVKPPAES
jgi:hypothetical protein